MTVDILLSIVLIALCFIVWAQWIVIGQVKHRLKNLQRWYETLSEDFERWEVRQLCVAEDLEKLESRNKDRGGH